MRYKALISENSLSFGSVQKLRDLGLFVPFLPSEDFVNIYAYVPEGLEIKRDIINKIHFFEDLDLWVEEKELVTFNDRVNQISTISKGDFVKIKGYGNLVLRVSDVSDNIVNTELNLRGSSFEIKSNIELVYKSDKLYIEDFRDFDYKHKNSVLVDLTEFNMYEGSDYFYKVFNFLLRLKLKFNKLNIILVNPLFGIEKVLGFDCYFVKGCLRGFISSLNLCKSDLFYSCDLHNFNSKCRFIYRHYFGKSDILLEITKENVYKVTGLGTFENLYFYLLFLKKKLEGVFQEDKIKRDINYDLSGFKKRYKLKKVKNPYSYRLKNNTFDYLIISRYLVENNLINLSENLDQYLDILRG